MAKLFGQEMTKDELLRLTGDVSQVAGVWRFIWAEGKEKGVEALEFRTGSGFHFVVLPDRGMDISYAEYQGIPLAWISPTGQTHPAFYEPEGLGWLRSFYGGLLVTCGLVNVGGPDIDPEAWTIFTGAPDNLLGGPKLDTDDLARRAAARLGELGEYTIRQAWEALYQKLQRMHSVKLGLHGRVANTPAQNVWADAAWEGDEYRLWAQGKVREAIVFGENLQLTRRIETSLGDKRLRIRDEVTNLGPYRTPHAMLYHVNPGWPAVAPGQRLVSSTRAVRPRDEFSRVGQDEYYLFQPPTEDYRERVYYHDMLADAEGYAYAAVINKSFRDGEGFGVYVKYLQATLPNFTQWKMNNVRTYVCGMEPCNCGVEGRSKDRVEGRLKHLDGGETVQYEVEIGVLSGPEEIAAFEAKVREIKGEQGQLAM